MKDTSRRLSVRRCLAGLAAALAIAAAGAQVPTQLPPIGTPVPGTMPQQAPTAEQLQMLQQLPESERQALMRALGISPLTGMQPGAGELPLQQPAPVAVPSTEESEPAGPPTLAAGDTIIVKLRLPRMEIDTDDDAPRRPPAAAGNGDEELGELQQLARLESSGVVDPELERLFQQRVQRNPQLGLLLGAATYVLDREGPHRFSGCRHAWRSPG